jgi:hypothetical protein
MSQNIFGYQGVNTPLESLTNGRYNVADYTTLRETVDARLSVLEKEQATPNDVTVSGSLSVIATTTGIGSITAAGPGSFGSTLFSNGTFSSNGGLLIAQGAQIGGTLTSTDTIYPLAGIEFPDGTTLTTANSGTTTPIYVNALLYSQSLGSTITPASSSYKNTEINLQFNNACTVNLANLNCEDSTAFPDGVRYVSITKANIYDGQFDVVVSCPVGSANYTFYGPNQNDVTSITMGTGIYGITLFIFKLGSVTRTYFKSIVKPHQQLISEYTFADVIISTAQLNIMDLVFYSNDRTPAITAANFKFEKFVFGQRITIIRSIQDISSSSSWGYWTGVPYEVIYLNGTVVAINSAGAVAAINPVYSGVQTIRSVWMVCPPSAGFSFTLYQIS